ncbi:hypothetical protein CcarbDRAFT_1779 [Clostridium carboxidivorans P7]|uniref:Uncharacterized protein n=1 Tax=Clostridium carboxidivorans P7 TaxID=536227 RepID=C6PSL2_9CLOT|nr:hypothetical protein CcarbDRAFT_1779 [Clostridium carboxidivorans P7]
MCGIAGWVNFQKNISEETEIIKNMTRTLKKEDQMMKVIIYLQIPY